MMQQLRNPTFMRIGMWIVLGLTVPSMVAFYGFSNINTSHHPAVSSALVTVDGAQGKEELGVEEIRLAQQDAADYYAQLVGREMGLQPQQYRFVAQQILNQLDNKRVAEFAVGQYALTERMEEQDLRVSDKQVSEHLRDQGMTREQLNQILQAQRISEYEFSQTVRAQLRNNQAANTVGGLARVSLLELWNEYLLGNEKLTVSYARIPVDVDFTSALEDAKVKEFYDKLVADKDPSTIDPPKRVYDLVVYRVPFEAPGQPTDADLQAAYAAAPDTDEELMEEEGFQVRQVLVTVPANASDAQRSEARARAVEAAGLIKQGTAFNVVADNFSTDLRNLKFDDNPTTPTLRGGLLPYRLKGTEIDAWGEAYIKFVVESQKGAVSDVLETPTGFAIVRNEGRFERVRKPFAEVESILRQRAQADLSTKATESRKQKQEEALQMVKDVRSTESTLAGMARALKVDVQSTSPTLAQSTFIMGAGNLNNEAEAIKLLVKGETSPVLQNSAGDAVILHVREEIPQGVRTLESMRPQVESRLRRQTAAEAARAKAEELKAAVAAGDTLTTKALTLGYKAENLPAFVRDTPPEAFKDAAQAPTVFASARQGDVTVLSVGEEMTPTELILAQVTKVEEPSREKFLTEMSDLERQLLSAKRQAFVEDFRRDALVALRPKYDDVFLGREKKDEKDQ